MILFFSCSTFVQTLVKGLGIRLLFPVILDGPEDNIGVAFTGSFFEVFLTIGFIFWLEGIWTLSYCFIFCSCPNWLEFFLLLTVVCGVLLADYFKVDAFVVFGTVLKLFSILLMRISAMLFFVCIELAPLWASSMTLLLLAITSCRVLTELRNSRSVRFVAYFKFIKEAESAYIF